MRVDPQSTPELDQLAGLITKAKVALLTTHDNEKRVLRARPMQTLRMDSSPALWFLTSISSPKVHEMDERSHACLGYITQNDYVSVSGVSQIIRDRAVIQELWMPLAREWFALDIDDPDVAALKLVVTLAEYWQARSGRLQQLFALAGVAQASDTSIAIENVKIEPP